MTRAARASSVLVVLVVSVAGCTSEPRAGTDQAAAQHAGLSSAPTPGSFAAFAGRKLTIGSDSVVLGGNVGCAPSGLPAGMKGSVELLPSAAVDSKRGVFGERVVLGKGSSSGDVYANELVDLGATHGQVYALPTLPNLAACAGATFTGTTLVVPAKSTVTLLGGTYSQVIVGEKASVRLVGGLYETTDFVVGSKSRIEALAPTEIHVGGRFQTGEKVELGPGTETELDASALRVAVLGVDSSEGEAAKVGTKSSIRAFVRVPSGTLRIGENSHVTGAMIAQVITLDSRVQVLSEGDIGLWPLIVTDEAVLGCVSPECVPESQCRGALDKACGFGSPACVHFDRKDGTACTDGNQCTVPDTCQSGACVPGAPVTDDGNPCTACDPATGAQVPMPSGTTCDDQDPCTEADWCDGAGLCAGQPKVVTDDNVCTLDSCDPTTGQVSHTPLPNGTDCGDGNPCNPQKLCLSGHCAQFPPPPANPCATCDPTSGGTIPLPAGTACDDKNLCTLNDQCDGSGLCKGKDKVVAVDSLCMVGTCDPQTGLVSVIPVADGTSCSDGNLCDGIEECQAGSCIAKDVPQVDDGNPCTTDICEPATGVSHVAKADGASCSNGDTCDGLETCEAGECKPGASPGFTAPASPCDFQFCDPATGTVSTAKCAPLDRTRVTPVAASMRFLYLGYPAATAPIQTGVDETKVTAARLAVIRGSVRTRAGSALPNVSIAVLGHPELGTTRTTTQGKFDLLVNGGGSLTVTYTKEGFLPVQRAIQVPWQDFVFAPDVVMIPQDALMKDAVTGQAAKLALGSQSWQALAGPLVSDKDGTRRAVLIAPPGVQAAIGGKPWSGSVSVRATEYSVGPDGPSTMPAELPRNSGYTFALELAADEALGKDVEFTGAPLAFYVESFIPGFVPGIAVPVGWYDRGKGAWIAENNGLVISVTSEASGVAEIDTGGVPLAIDTNERKLIAQLYDPPQVLWRVPLTHFSPYDFNWAPEWPDDDPDDPDPDKDDPTDDPCEQQSSVIECQNQILGEEVAIAGTPLTLRYGSDRVYGRSAARSLVFALTGASVPAGLKRIEVVASVAGRSYKKTYVSSLASPLTNQTFTLDWDGRNAYGQLVQGRQRAVLEARYAFEGGYVVTGRFAGAGNGTPIIGTTGREDVVLPRVWNGYIGTGSDALPLGIGGWTLSVQHAYDPLGGVLYLGDGSRRSAKGAVPVLTLKSLGQPRGLAVGPDGSVYVADFAKVLRVLPNGEVQTIAGTGNDGFSGDGGAATSAMLSANLSDVAVADGAVLIADSGNGRVRVVKDGIISTIAGSGPSSVSTGDGGPATQAKLGGLRKIAVGPDGSLYVAEGTGNVVRQVATDGTILRVAGNGSLVGDLGEGGPATMATVSLPIAVAAGPDGRVYFSHSAANGAMVIRSVGPDGLIKRVAGTWVKKGADTDPTAKDGIPATEEWLRVVSGLDVGPDGAVYVSETRYSTSGPELIRRIDGDGLIWTIAGDPTGKASEPADGSATGVKLNGPLDVAVAPDQLIYFVDGVLLRTVARGLPPTNFEKEIAIPTADARFVDFFDPLGRHLRTQNALTGAATMKLEYGADGLVAKLIDGDANTTTITRETGKIMIRGPFQPAPGTTLLLDSNGYATTIRDQLNQDVVATYDPAGGGLLQKFKDARGNLTTYVFDALGRLIEARDPVCDAVGPSQSCETLARVATTDGFDAVRTSPLGLVTTYSTDSTVPGAEKLINVFPNGTKASVESGTAGKRVTKVPDGTTVTEIIQGDPRFGLAAPVISTHTMTPSGLVRTETAARTVTPDPIDPYKVASQTDSVLVSGHGSAAKSVFTAATNELVTTSPGGRVVTLQLDALGRTKKRQQTGILAVEFSYDANGRLEQVVQGSRTRKTAYFDTAAGSQAGFVKSVTNALNEQTSFNPDAIGRVLDQTEPGNVKTSFTWDGNSNLTSVTPPGKPTHAQGFTPVNLLNLYEPPEVPGLPTVPGLPVGATRRSYDIDRRLTTVLRPDGLASTRSYDPIKGQLTDLQTPAGNVKYEYYLPTEATPGRVKRITDPGGVVLDFGYDGLLAKSQTWSGAVSGSVSFAYDTAFRVASESATAGTTSSVAYFGYDPDDFTTCASPSNTCSAPGTEALQLTFAPANGLLASSKLGAANVNDAWTYNAYGELASYTASAGTTAIFSEVLDTATSPRDALGRIVDRVETNGGSPVAWHYTYDSRGRLTDVARDGAPYQHYDYDLNGNRKLNGNGTYDDQDRLLTYGTVSFTYTANGDLSSKSTPGAAETPTTYSYDLRGNLVQVVLPTGDVIDYLVDGQNRRVGRKKNGVLEKQWLYRNQLNVAAELDGTGALVSRFIYASRGNVPDIMIRDGTTYRIVSDHLGSPRAIADAATGTVVWRADFDPWGRRTVTVGAEDFLPMGFAGGLFDAESGLVRFGARDYDPSVGRWTAREPRRFGDGTNFFVYAFNDSVNFLDQDGQAAGPDDAVLLGGLLVTALEAAGVVAAGYAAAETGYCAFKYGQCKLKRPNESSSTGPSGPPDSVCNDDEDVPPVEVPPPSSPQMNSCESCLKRCIARMAYPLLNLGSPWPSDCP